MSKIEMFLVDGRVLDLSDLSHDEFLAVLDREGVTPELIKETRHYLPVGTLPSITCPRCGKTSYNLNDVRERYCGNCHQFHDTMEPRDGTH